MTVSSTSIERQIGNVLVIIEQQVGCRRRELYSQPMTYYIGSGRASVPFLAWFVSAEPETVASLLLKGGSTNESIERLKRSAHI